MGLISDQAQDSCNACNLRYVPQKHDKHARRDVILRFDGIVARCYHRSQVPLDSSFAAAVIHPPVSLIDTGIDGPNTCVDCSRE